MRQLRAEPALRGLFDHAGMFPPATKSLPDALRDAARFPGTLKRPGIVGAELVLAWKAWPDLDEATLKKAGYTDAPCRIAVVGVPLAEGPAVARQIAAHNAQRPKTPVVSLEVHAEGDIDDGVLRATVAAAAATPVFLEPRWASARMADHARHVSLVCKAVGAGLKVRCAGPTALDARALAAAIVAAADAGIAFKATQGLHHPLPRPGFPHGFLGLLAALRLRQVEGDSFRHIEECLTESEASAFDFTDGITWRGHHVPAARLATLPPLAIGSCSLTEPDDDLMAEFGPPRT